MPIYGFDNIFKAVSQYTSLFWVAVSGIKGSLHFVIIFMALQIIGTTTINVFLYSAKEFCLFDCKKRKISI